MRTPEQIRDAIKSMEDGRRRVVKMVRDRQADLSRINSNITELHNELSATNAAREKVEEKGEEGDIRVPGATKGEYVVVAPIFGDSRRLFVCVDDDRAHGKSVSVSDLRRAVDKVAGPEEKQLPAICSLLSVMHKDKMRAIAREEVARHAEESNAKPLRGGVFVCDKDRTELSTEWGRSRCGHLDSYADPGCSRCRFEKLLRKARIID